MLGNSSLLFNELGSSSQQAEHLSAEEENQWVVEEEEREHTELLSVTLLRRDCRRHSGRPLQKQREARHGDDRHLDRKW